MRDPVKNTNSTSTQLNKGPWLWAIVLVIVVGATAFWFNGSQNAAEPIPDLQGNDVEQITDTAPIPVEDADPDPVPPQDAVIPPAPIPPTPSQ